VFAKQYGIVVYIKMVGKKLILDGERLTIEDIVSLVRDDSLMVEVPAETLKRVSRAHEFLKSESIKRVIYGVNTGFGPMVSRLIGKNQLVDLQYNLVRSHAMGLGEPISSAFSLVAMVVRLNTLLRGYSGVSKDLIKQIELFINHRLLPVIPEHGAVGTSGDLVQLAHIALALIGEGEVFYKGVRQDVAPILQKLELVPYKLQAKEGLSLINGTSVMAGITALLVDQAELALSVATRNGALAMEIVGAFKDSLDQDLQFIRPHPGQIKIAEVMRNLVQDSNLLRERKNFQLKHKLDDDVREIKESGQEVYSLRCIPQILGPIYEVIAQAKKTVEIEINSVTDNPIVSVERDDFIHGGNFHGDYIASAADCLKTAIIKLTILSERRLNFFLHDKINAIFPPFLNLKQPGLSLGLQGLQFVATSTTAQSQSLAYPHSLHSIPTNGDNQDVVSMGTDAALFMAKVIDNAFIVLAIELIALAQAVDCKNDSKKLSKAAILLYQSLRHHLPIIIEDRVLIRELPATVNWLKTDQNMNLFH